MGAVVGILSVVGVRRMCLFDVIGLVDFLNLGRVNLVDLVSFVNVNLVDLVDLVNSIYLVSVNLINVRGIHIRDIRPSQRRCRGISRRKRVNPRQAGVVAGSRRADRVVRRLLQRDRQNTRVGGGTGGRNATGQQSRRDLGDEQARKNRHEFPRIRLDRLPPVPSADNSANSRMHAKATGASAAR